MIHRAGSDRLHRLSWDEALAIVAEELRDVPGERMGFFATSRGIVNETYYAFQKARAADGLEPRRPVHAPVPRGERLGPQGHARRSGARPARSRT